jgi:hypothetical protein
MYPRLKAASSSGEPNPTRLREAVLAILAAEHRGLVVRVGSRRSRRDFALIRVRGGDVPLSVVDPIAIRLLDRKPLSSVQTSRWSSIPTSGSKSFIRAQTSI